MSIFRVNGEDRIKTIIKYPKFEEYPREDQKLALSFHMTAQELMIMIRRRLDLKSSQTLVLMCGPYMLNGGAMMCDVYKKFGTNDSPLVIRCVEENVFG